MINKLNKFVKVLPLHDSHGKHGIFFGTIDTVMLFGLLEL